MKDFSNIFLLPYRKHNRALAASPSATETIQPATFMNKQQTLASSPLSSLPPSPRRPWMRFTSVVTLAGYVGQLTCQLLMVSGLWGAQTVSIGAMEPDRVRLNPQLPATLPLAPTPGPRQETPYIFRHSDQETNGIVTKIFSHSSDEKTLGQASQVCWRWYGLITFLGHHIPAINYGSTDTPDPRREALLRNIITVTQAEYDWPCHVTTTLAQVLPALLKGNLLKKRLAQLASQIKQPEDLLFFGPGETERVLYRNGLSHNHTAFGTFRSLIRQVDTLAPGLQGDLHNDLQKLRSFYEGYINVLCACEDDPDRKEHLLAKKVFLKTEKPLEFLPFSYGFYRISQEMARQLISKDRYGFVDKKNDTGMRAVQSQGGVHFKFLDTALDDHRPGIEYMAYAFAAALTPQFLVTPSVLLKLEGVSLLDTTENFPAKLMEVKILFETKREIFLEAKKKGKSLDEALVDLDRSLADPQFSKSKVPLLEAKRKILLEAKSGGKNLDEAMAGLNLQAALDEAAADLHLSHQGGWKQFVQLQDHNCFVQASQTVGNKDLAKVLEGNPTWQGDPTTMGWQILFSLLTAPGDGKADNYSMDETDASGVDASGTGVPENGKHVIGIDNDKLFYPPLYQTKTSLYTGINCVFYLLNSLMDDTVLPENVQKPFLAINPAQTVLNWLAMLQSQNRRYQRLADLGILQPYDLKTLGLPIHLPAGLPKQVMEQITRLQAKLNDHPASTPHQLLGSLYPSVAAYYKALREQYPNDPLAAMWVAYKGRDQAGALQTVNTVLGLSPHEKVWQEAPTKRTSSFQDDLVTCLKTFMPHIPKTYLEGRLNPLLSLVLDYFGEWADNLLPVLPDNAWHQVVQEQTRHQAYNAKVLHYLHKRDPEGLNRLDATHKTPLDIAFGCLSPNTAGMAIDLINKGAWQVSLSERSYRDLKKQAKQFPTSFWETFKALQERNAKVGWTVTLEELFPITQKQGKNTIRGTSNETRLLTETVLQQLQDPHREIKEGRRDVFHVDDANGCSAFLKFYPELVGIEEAVGELTRRTIGFGAPYGELFRFPDELPVWVSQGISGQTLQWVLNNDPGRLTCLDPVSTANMILMAMLVNPEDGKPDNYIVEPLPGNPNLYRLSSPDNDHGFVPAFVKPKPHPGNIFRKPELVVHVKTILYCLDQMNEPIPEETKALFLKGEPLVLMQGWLDVLDRRNQRYAALYSSQEASALFKGHECFMGVPFQKGMISHLYSKWVRLQDCLSEQSLTPLQLLSKVEPRLANRYREAFKVPNVWDRFKQVDGAFYHQKGNHWTTLTPSGSILTSQNIPMQESTLEAIRNGTELGPKQAIAELQEIVKQKNATGLSIEHMATDKQREDFLKGFDFGQYPISEQRKIVNQLTAKISQGAKLINLTLKNCVIIEDSVLQSHFLINDLVRLDLNGCQAVTHKMIPLLSQMPGLEILNLSNLPKLRWVADAGYINYGPVSFPQLRTLNLNNCPALEAIDIDVPKLNGLWAQGAKKLNLLKIKSTMDDEVLYRILSTLEDPNLKIAQVDLTGCPNVTAGAKKILAFFLGAAKNALDLSGTPIGAVGVAALSTRTDIKTLAIDSDDLGHFWGQPNNIGTLQVKGKITDENLCQILLYPTELQQGQVNLTKCPNVTPKGEQALKDFYTAQQGDLDALHRLGMIYFGLKNYEGSKEWYRRAVSQGDDGVHEIITLLGEADERRYEEIWRMRLSIPIARGGHEETYQRFLNGRLIYKPNEDNDIGKIELRIADLANPLEGTFDLSQCGNMGRNLSISAGYKKGRKPENEDKVEIWLVPRFMVEKEINGSAGHFKKIFPALWREDAPVGIIWTWWRDGLSHYDYLTSDDFVNIANGDLRRKWGEAWTGHMGRGGGPGHDGRDLWVIQQIMQDRAPVWLGLGHGGGRQFKLDFEVQ